MNRSYLRRALMIGWLAVAATSAWAQNPKIFIKGNKFVVSGRQIWLNGCNTPWNNWQDFGTGRYNNDWWDGHMTELEAANINCIRVWFNCDNSGGPIVIGTDGTVSGVTPSFFADCDLFFALAKKHKIYILATLLSFDHTKEKPGTEEGAKFRACYQDRKKVDLLVERYMVPFAKRFQSNPYLFAIDICNEIEWINNAGDPTQPHFSWDILQYLVARAAAGIHAKSSILVTMGSAGVKWNTDVNIRDGISSIAVKSEGNKWSDKSLQAQFNDPKARLDFYQLHWYTEQTDSFGNPAIMTSPATYQIDDRPCIIGEVPAIGLISGASGSEQIVNNPNELYEGAYQHGWQGVMCWTSNGVDRFGNLSNFKAATRAFNANHHKLVYPDL